MSDNTVAYGFAAGAKVVGVGHALNGVVVVKHHVFGWHPQQIVAATAYKLQFILEIITFRRVDIENAATLGHAGQVIEQAAIAFFFFFRGNWAR